MTKIDFALYDNEPSTQKHRQSKKEKPMNQNKQLKDPYKLEYIETTELIKHLYMNLRFLTDYIKTHRHHPYWLCMQVKYADQFLRETENFYSYHVAPNYLDVVYKDWSE